MLNGIKACEQSSDLQRIHLSHNESILYGICLSVKQYNRLTSHLVQLLMCRISVGYNSTKSNIEIKRR